LIDIAAVLCMFLLRALFTDIWCSLLSEPDHVMVSEGSSANFTCRSTTAGSILWRYTALGGSSSVLLHDAMQLPSGASVSISYTAADQKTSAVTLHGVRKRDTGMMACVDDREKSFAELTVVGELVEHTLPGIQAKHMYAYMYAAVRLAAHSAQ